MDVQTLKKCVKAISEIPPFEGKKFRKPAVMIRGRHGIGKTDLVHEIGEELGLPVIDKRLGQMTEGDIQGLPWKEGGVTRYAPVDFVKRACDAPCILFFDEGNRAIREVLQGVFQMVQDGEFNGHVFHPDTLVFFAINNSSEYQVTKMDPALKDRFFIVDFTPTFEDWVKWAEGPKGKLHHLVINFLKANYRTHPEYFELSKEPADPNEITPSRRAWEKFARTAEPFLNEAEMFGVDEKDENGKRIRAMLFALLSGFLGSFVGAAFLGWLANQITLTVDDVLDNWDTVGCKKINRLGDTRWHRVKDVVTTFCRTNKLTDAQAENLGKAILGMPGELCLSMWMSIANDVGVDNPITVHNVRIMHPFCGPKFLTAINGTSNTAGALP